MIPLQKLYARIISPVYQPPTRFLFRYCNSQPNPSQSVRLIRGAVPIRRFVHTEKEKETKANVQQISQQGVSTKNTFAGSLISWKSVTLMVVLGGISLFILKRVKDQRYKEINKVASVGDAAIGAPFFLVDQFGKPTSSSDFKGKFLLVYFGFTYCPDICPTEMKKMADIINKLESSGLEHEVVPLFITIDPWRDTVEQIRQYAKEFHPRILALTGTPNQITKVAKAYRVYMNKAGSDDEYLVDHSIILYLMGRDGKYVKYYGKNATAEEVYNSIVEYVTPPELSWWVTFKRAMGLE